MSSADDKDTSDTGSESVDETVVDLENTGSGETVDDAVDDRSDASAADSKNAEKRAARQAKKESSKDAQVTIPVRALKQFGLAIVAIAAVVAIALSIFQVVEKNKQLDAFTDSKSAAAHFIETYFNAMGGANATPESLRNAVGPLSTGEFKERLGSDAVVSTDFMKQNKVENMKTTVTSSMVESFDADRSTVVLGVDITGTSAASATPASQAVLLQVEMAKVDGEWLVSSIGAGPGITVGAQQGQPAPPDTTTAPAPAPATP
ncbi:hypothetical protein [Gordonia hydrophobica]|uniref:Mce-associated membrane protein n=1 Tax=Gordonia hydrophobica TaxID=40516 RepID=A0ABZ2TYZ0_9ACTN|nr:hypothetical protein [Gordonia hydrophobica]MBM7367144.1 Mce-associated membrane protein [Gordonia hydrophobica]